MKLIIVFVTFYTISVAAFGFDVRCSFGARCIASQGTKIPSSKVIEMMDLCNDFTRGDIGSRMLKISMKEIMDASRGSPTHALTVAEYAFDQLRDSPLAFDRKSNTEDTSYFEIKKSCSQLVRDFNRDTNGGSQ